MGRPPKDFSTIVPPGLADASPEAIELGMEPHFVNFVSTHYVITAAGELAHLRGSSVSDIVRSLLDEAFAEFEKEQPGVLSEAAVAELEFRAERQKRRAEYHLRITI